jgi:hypothetical protein
MIDMTELIVIVVGLLAAIALVVIERLGTSNHKALEAMLNGMADHADKLLSGYSAQLKPLYDLVLTAEAFIDDDSDPAVQYLPDDVIELLREVAEFAKRYTDGAPPVETLPPDPANEQAPIEK